MNTKCKNFSPFYLTFGVFLMGAAPLQAMAASAEEEIEKNVLLEQFTGQDCTSCPSAHTLISTCLETCDVGVVEVAHHSGFIADFFSMTEDWDILNLFDGSTYNPAVSLNRSMVGGNSTPVFGPYSVSDTKASIVEAANQPAYVSLMMSSEFDEATRQLTTEVQVYTHEVPPCNEIHYTLYLVQDHLVAYQKNGGNNYVHQAVSRGCLTEGSWGETVTLESGGITTLQKTVTLPEGILSTYYKKAEKVIPVVLDDMKIVVLVHRCNPEDPYSNTVYNCVEGKIGEQVVQRGFPETVGVSGLKVSDTPSDCYDLWGRKGTRHGVVIQNGKKVKL